MGSQEANERIPEAGHLEPPRYVGGGDGVSGRPVAVPSLLCLRVPGLVR